MMSNRDGSAARDRNAAEERRAPSLLAAAILLLSCLALPIAAAAQDYAISSVGVEGNQRIETATILDYAAIAPGQTVTAGEVNDAYQRLLATGLFESVEVLPRGGRLLIRVSEYPTINVINFEGNRRINDDQLVAVISSQPRRVYSPAEAERDAETIASAYAQEGRYAARVKPVIIRRADNRVDLVFEIREGRVSEVERLSFVGNRAFTDRRLRRVLETKQAGFLRAFIRTDTFVADRIEFDKQVLTDFYRSRGFIDFRVLSATPEFSRERNAFFLTFRVQEGQSFDFGEITVTSELPEIDTDEYLDAVRLRPGVTYSPVLVENAIERLENLAIRNGLSFIRAVPRVTRNDADLTLDIEFVIERGERIFVERIDIEGNTTTLDRVIRRQFRIVEGDPFNPREIRQSAERIRALGLFANAEVTAREGSSPDRVIVDVDVEEQPTGSLSFGLNYSTDDGLGAAISFSERNFLGRGQTLRMSFESGTDNSNSEITFIEPAFLDRDLRLGLSAYLRETTRNTDLSESYDTSRLGFTPSLQFPVGENSRLGLRYLIEQDEISGISATDTSAIIKDDEGTRLTSAIGYTYTYDTRRGGLDPDAGVILQFSQDLAGLGGDAQYLRTDFLVGAERRFERRDLTLSAEFEGGALSSIDGNSRLTDRYFMGSSKMRGFERGGIGPRDLATAADDALGGNYYAVARFEAAFPLGLPEEYGLSGGLFYDIGSIWGLDDVDGGASGSDGLDIVDDSRYWRSVVGFSLFWDTQIGPLRFNFSKAIQKEDYDEDRAFDLTIEARF